MIETLNEALAGRYHVESLAGRGGMASVYRATDLRHGRQVAIKVMHPEYAESVGLGGSCVRSTLPQASRIRTFLPSMTPARRATSYSTSCRSSRACRYAIA